VNIWARFELWHKERNALTVVTVLTKRGEMLPMRIALRGNTMVNALTALTMKTKNVSVSHER